MKKALSYILISALAASAAWAQKKQQQNIDPSELSYGENLACPTVPSKALSPIKNHLNAVQAWFAKHGYDAKLTRNGEVVLITIPCSSLFAPNSTEIKEAGLKLLQPFVTYLQHPTMYKVVVAVHSDNTGEQGYTDELTSDRANAIDEYLETQGQRQHINLIPYGLGQDEPLKDNSSIANRNDNRRVEIYIIPEWQMIDNARAGKLK